MNIRHAILRAADQIEKNPQEFRYSAVTVPEGPGCGTPGCALGWIGYFSGVAAGKTLVHVAPHAGDYGTSPIMSVGASVFYTRMAELDYRWSGDAAVCASALRAYADKYHPEDLNREDDGFLRFLEKALAPYAVTAAERSAS